MLSSCTDWSAINQNGDVPIYLQVDKNIGEGLIILLSSVNTLRFKSREIPTFSFYIDWFTQNYKD